MITSYRILLWLAAPANGWVYSLHEPSRGVRPAAPFLSRRGGGHGEVGNGIVVRAIIDVLYVCIVIRIIYIYVVISVT